MEIAVCTERSYNQPKSAGKSLLCREIVNKTTENILMIKPKCKKRSIQIVSS
jgi:hypothetical protein